MPALHPARGNGAGPLASLARLGRLEEAANARDTLLQNYPDFSVERHLRNFRWKNPDDIAHYREGLVKAGVPYGTIALVKRAAD